MAFRKGLNVHECIALCGFDKLEARDFSFDDFTEDTGSTHNDCRCIGNELCVDVVWL